MITLITKEYIKAIEKINIVSKCDYIGFHGQTVFHDPKNSKTIQLGNAKLISNHFKKPIVYQFRKMIWKTVGKEHQLLQFIINF